MKRLRHALLIAFVLTTAIACNPDPHEYSVEGKLLVVFMQSPGGDPYRYLLQSGDIQYQLVFDTETRFVNIQSTASGDVWQAGGWYGVDGQVEGKTLNVDAIEYLGSPPALPPPEPQAQPEPLAPVKEEPAVVEPAPAVEEPAPTPPHPNQGRIDQTKLEIDIRREDCRSLDALIAMQRAEIHVLEQQQPKEQDGAISVALDENRSSLEEHLAEQPRCQEQLAELEQYLETLKKQNQ